MKKVNDIFAHTDCVSEEMMLKYISGKLSPAEKHEVEKHLVDCEMCSDAVEGLSMLEGKKISSITSELNQKIQNRVEKKEVKVIFIRQYRTQLAVAASIVLVLGLVWFFKANVSMKEMDNAEAEKMFAEKFSPPPSEKENEATTGKEQTEPDTKNPVATAQEPAAEKTVVVHDAEKKVSAQESPSFDAVEEVKMGKDEKHLEENFKGENIPVQKAEQAQTSSLKKSEEKKEDKNLYWRNSNGETPKGNVSSESKLKSRDEDNDRLKDEVAKTTVTKEEVQKNQNELESLKKEKEKDKKFDESKKSQQVTSTTEVTTVLTPTENTAAGGAANNNAPVQEKSGALANKQDAKKPSDDRERNDANSVNRGQNGEGDVLAYETVTKSGGKGKKAKEKAPQKVSGGFYDTQTSTSAPMPETPETKVTTSQNMAGEDINGKQVMADSISAGITTFGSTATISDATISLDGAMEKYDKKDYAGAASDFESALKKNPNDEKALFYSAVSYLSLGQTEKALTNFNKILANKNSKYYDDAQWYSSLAYIKNNDMKNARMNLNMIQQNEKSRYKKQADETLEQIKK